MTEQTIESLMPTVEYMRPAWVGALKHAIKDDELLSRFRDDTGNQWTPERTPLDQMIDKATGAERDFVFSFIRWFNRWIWGEVDGRACNGDESEGELWGPPKKEIDK